MLHPAVQLQQVWALGQLGSSGAQPRHGGCQAGYKAETNEASRAVAVNITDTALSFLLLDD